MIKRWTIHLEFHRGYWPKFYIRPNPRHGDRVVDGGVLGTLKRCPTCQDGFLHDPDLVMTSVTETDRGLKVTLRRPSSNHIPSPAIDLNASPTVSVPLPMTTKSSVHKVGDIVEYLGNPYTIRAIGSDADGSNRVMYMDREGSGLVGPSPETLILDYTKGLLTYEVGDDVYTRLDNYVVTAFVPGEVLILRRKDTFPLSDYEMKLRRGDIE